MPTALSHALAQTWPPFVLIAGLLLVGVVAASDRLFEAAGTLAARLPGGGRVLFSSLMALVIVVTVILNLDTSVVFLTPILLHAARRRHLGETAFLYGAVFMSNSASLLLPGSNLTNLLVLHGHGVSGGAFAARMAPAWAAAVVVTLVVLTVWRRPDLTRRPREPIEPVVPRVGAGMVGVAGATGLVLALPNPAVPVLVLGVVVVAVQRFTGRLPLSVAARSANPALLTGLFVVAVALGWLSRVWGAPGRLMGSATSIATAWIAVAAAGLVNNLPAAVLLSSQSPLHPRALLIGLDLGPNLVVTGSLSAVFWLQVAKREGASPSVRTYSAVGILLVPLTVMAALAATGALAPGSL
ncbi:MAG TPA: SLC13 family permease [Acidimicrobiales bacterium]|nr:SLC13 family permease [Acidimicrobiales bacterium]